MKESLLGLMIFLGVGAAGPALVSTSAPLNIDLVELNQRAVDLQASGRLREARAAYIEAAEICGRAVEELAECARIWNNLGSLYYQMGRLGEAQMFTTRAVDKWRTQNSPADLSSAISNLAAVHRGLGHFDQSLELYREALVLRTSIYGDQDAHTLATLDGMALLENAFGNYAKAEALARRELSAITRDDRFAIVRAEMTLAASLRGQQKLDEAVKLYQDALEQSQRLFGERPTWIAEGWNGLGLTYRMQSRPAEAEQCYRRALEIFRKAGCDNQEAAALNNLALLATPRPGKHAARLYEQAIAAADRVPDANRATTSTILSNYAALLMGHREFAKAHAVTLRVLATDRANGAPHTRIAIDQGRAGVAAHGLHRYAESAQLLESALLVLEHYSGEDASDVGIFAAILAEIRTRQKRFGEAATNYQTAVERLRPVWGDSDRRMLGLLRGESNALRQSGEFAGAAKVDLLVTRGELTRALR